MLSQTHSISSPVRYIQHQRLFRADWWLFN
jgi:hypothetical protein